MDLLECIVFEDEDLLIVNKPSGLPSQSTVDKSRPDLYSILLNSGRWKYLGLHHRLDAPTSGLMILAKSKRANLPISQMFQSRELVKKYRCWVKGEVSDSNFIVENHLKQVKFGKKTLMKVVLSGGDYSKTTFELKCKKTFKKIIISELEAELHTGRMHQIRIHCRSLNLPILGDSLYGPIDRNFKRLMLHAHQLHFNHPFSKELLYFEAPLPNEFKKLNELE